MEEIELVDKYKPQSLLEIAGNADLVQHFKDMIDGKTPASITLLWGPPGVGKTSMIDAFIHEAYGANYKDYYMEVDGSQQGQRGIDATERMIIPFIKTRAFDGKRKVLFIDEFDGFTQDAQRSLRKSFEKYKGNCQILLACNYIEKIIPAMADRHNTFEVVLYPEEMIQKLKFIAGEEKKVLPDYIYERCVAASGGSLRKAIQNLEQAIAGRTEFSTPTYEFSNKIFENAMNQKLTAALDYKVGNVRETIKEIWEIAMKMAIPDLMKGEISMYASVYIDRAARGYEQVQLAAFISSLIVIAKKYGS